MKTKAVAMVLVGALVVLGLLVWLLREPDERPGGDAGPDAGPARPATLPPDAADRVLPLVLDALAACGQRAKPACTGGGQLSFQIAAERGRARVGQLRVEPAVLAPAVEECTRQAVRQLDFGRDLGSGSLEVMYPLACRDGQLRLPRPADRTRTRPVDLPPQPAPAEEQAQQQGE